MILPGIMRDAIQMKRPDESGASLESSYPYRAVNRLDLVRNKCFLT